MNFVRLGQMILARVRNGSCATSPPTWARCSASAAPTTSATRCAPRSSARRCTRGIEAISGEREAAASWRASSAQAVAHGDAASATTRSCACCRSAASEPVHLTGAHGRGPGQPARRPPTPATPACRATASLVARQRLRRDRVDVGAGQRHGPAAPRTGARWRPRSRTGRADRQHPRRRCRRRARRSAARARVNAAGRPAADDLLRRLTAIASQPGELGPASLLGRCRAPRGAPAAPRRRRASGYASSRRRRPRQRQRQLKAARCSRRAAASAATRRGAPHRGRRWAAASTTRASPA